MASRKGKRPCPPPPQPEIEPISKMGSIWQAAVRHPRPRRPAAAAPAGDAANGGKIYSTACVACHGPDAKGVTGLGKDLTTSTWVGEQSDTQLVEFIKKGRDVTDPLNTTGVAMPPKGGNPAMSEQEIADIVAYVRSIHQQ